MSEISDGNIKMGPGIREQMSTFHKFEATSREQFEELIKVMNHLQEETKRENKSKDELRNLKGPKKEVVMEEKIKDTWYHKQHKQNEEEHGFFIPAKERSLMYGMSMNINDIGSIRTLTYDETEELARTGDLKSDNKFKKRKLACM